MLRVPKYTQSLEGYCGPACLRMILGYFGLHKSEADIGKLCGTSIAAGTPGEALVKGAKKLGFHGLIKDWADFADIGAYVKKKKVPVMVDWFSVDDGHYSVVVDITAKDITIIDPETGKIRSFSRTIFKRIWFDFRGEYMTSKTKIYVRRMIAIWKEDETWG